MESMHVPEPVMSVAANPQTQKDETKFMKVWGWVRVRVGLGSGSVFGFGLGLGSVLASNISVRVRVLGLGIGSRSRLGLGPRVGSGYALQFVAMPVTDGCTIVASEPLGMDWVRVGQG